MYLHPVFYVTLSCFLIGGLLIAFINKRKGKAALKENKARWLKYWVYFILVHGIIITVLAGGWYFRYLMIVVMAVGAIEIIYQGIKAGQRYYLAICLVMITYSIITIGFYHFTGLGNGRILFVYVLVLCFDGFSQLSGQLMGKIKLIPKISPGKTVEGLAGGAILTLIIAVIIRSWVFMEIYQSALLSIEICASALIGDLLASYYKRILGIKDYGKTIPGHGGILDRFDGFLMAGAIYYSVLMY